jgi:hypothetical protein
MGHNHLLYKTSKECKYIMKAKCGLLMLKMIHTHTHESPLCYLANIIVFTQMQDD